MASGPLTVIVLIGILTAFVVLRIALGGRSRIGPLAIGLFVAVLIGAVVILFSAAPRNSSRSSSRAPSAFVSINRDGTPIVSARSERGRATARVSSPSRPDRAPDAAAWAEDAPPKPRPPSRRVWDYAEALGRIAGRVFEICSREYIERNWTDFSPTALSFPEHIIVIGRGSVETRRPYDKRQLKSLWRQVEVRARESASEELAHSLRALRETSDPALRDLRRKLKQVRSRRLEQIAAKILGRYGVTQTGPQTYPEGRGGSMLEQAVRYQIGRDQLVSALLEELGGSSADVGITIGTDSRRHSTSVRGIVFSTVVVWLLVIGASSILRAGTRRRLGG